MYIPSRPPNTTSCTNSRHRRPDLSLIKPPHWSYSNNLERAYPSPPMSDSPTSPRRLSLYPDERSSTNFPGAASTAQPGEAYQVSRSSMEGPVLAAPPSLPHQMYGQPSPSYLPPQQRPELQPRPITSYPPYPPQQYEPYFAPSQPPLPLVPSSRTPVPGMATFQGPTSMGPAAPRIQGRTRRTKAHVAKACQNCKKAHLSCDEARPCARCVASGKQETCIDVEHKKRGRPRLRDDRDSRLEQQAAAQVGAQQAAGQPPHPIRSHRRGNSLRTLQSQAYASGSDESRPSTSQGMGSARSSYIATGATSAGYQYYRSGPASSEPPLTAFLNMNLHILKASDALRSLFVAGQDLTERSLIDFVTPQYEGALQRVQNELRDERNRLEPALLPSIFPEEADRNAVRDRDPEEADSLSRSFADRSDVYTFRTAVGQTEQFQVRIRLARTSSFFATMTLYRMQPPPAVAPSPYARGSQYAVGDSSSPARSSLSMSNPPSPFSTLPTALMTTLPPPSSIPASYTYAPPQRSELGYYGRGSQAGMYPPPLPPLAPAESRPVAADDHKQRRGTGEQGFQLPPIVSSAPTTPLTSQFFESGVPTSAGSTSRRRSPEPTSADDSEEEYRKRRRLNIKDIVEK